MEPIIFIAFVAVSVLTAVANLFAATSDFIRPQWLLVAMDEVGIPESWLPILGALKAAGALGLLIGIIVPPIGIAAAAGLVIFFVGAIITHLRVRDYSFGPQYVFLLLAVATLVLGLAS